MKAIRVLGVDPSLAHFGMARVILKLDTLQIGIESLRLVNTERRVNKSVRQNSDDLRRSQEITSAFRELAAPCTVCFAEIPAGAQDARAALSFGVSIGIISGCPIPVIQVQPHETKLATVGTKTASKSEMIEWGLETYPSAPWIRLGGKPAGRVLKDNEHLADAIAVVHAGIATDQFKQLLAILRSTPMRAVA